MLKIDCAPCDPYQADPMNRTAATATTTNPLLAAPLPPVKLLSEDERHKGFKPIDARPLIQTASELVCPHCQGTLSICQHRDRFVYRLDGLVHQICRDKRCLDKECDGPGTIYRPLVDLRLALPCMSFGLDVVMSVGE